MSQSVASSAPSERTGITWQKVILGDWTRLVRDPLDILRIVFFVAAIAWGVSGRPVTTVIGAAAVLILARIVSLPRFYDFSLFVVMLLLAWGEVLGWYDSFDYYDNVVHFTVPFLVTGMIYLLLVRLGVMPELRALTQLHQRFGFFLTALALGMAIGAGWEIVEWTLDSTTSSHLVVSARDTATDLISDTLGAAGSALVLVLWSLGNHSLKRRSGAELAHKRFSSFLKVRAV
jgi:hypothetical protein